MPLVDLLQWVGSARRTGVLRLELDKVSKQIVFRDGEVAGCSSDDPPERLGQYLIGRGRIDERQLLEALAAQESSGKHLGRILVEMGVLRAEELEAHLTEKAEETILSLFDWPDATFRYQDGEDSETPIYPIRLPVEVVLLRGVQRYDEMQRIRQALPEPAIVLRRTATAPPEAVLENPLVRAIYDAIDADRTIADVRLHVRGSEYVVLRCLFELLHSGHLEIAGVKRLIPIGPPVGPARPRPGPSRPRDPDLELGEPPANTDRPAREAPAGARRAPAPADTLEARLVRAREAMKSGRLDAALDVLDALYREFPGDDALRRLTAEAEAAFVEKAYRHYLPSGKLVRLTRPLDELTTQRFSSPEFFLLSRIDGTLDVRSIVQVVPLREADALRTLKRLREAAVIELVEPARAPGSRG